MATVKEHTDSIRTHNAVANGRIYPAAGTLEREHDIDVARSIACDDARDARALLRADTSAPSRYTGIRPDRNTRMALACKEEQRTWRQVNLVRAYNRPHNGTAPDVSGGYIGAVDRDAALSDVLRAKRLSSIATADRRGWAADRLDVLRAPRDRMAGVASRSPIYCAVTPTSLASAGAVSRDMRDRSEGEALAIVTRVCDTHGKVAHSEALSAARSRGLLLTGETKGNGSRRRRRGKRGGKKHKV